jgi:hypothetical protein
MKNDETMTSMNNSNVRRRKTAEDVGELSGTNYGLA